MLGRLLCNRSKISMSTNCNAVIKHQFLYGGSFDHKEIASVNVNFKHDLEKLINMSVIEKTSIGTYRVKDLNLLEFIADNIENIYNVDNKSNGNKDDKNNKLALYKENNKLALYKENNKLALYKV
jgi:hypothetical protein